jgi:hypothetical protein
MFDDPRIVDDSFWDKPADVFMMLRQIFPYEQHRIVWKMYTHICKMPIASFQDIAKPDVTDILKKLNDSRVIGHALWIFESGFFKVKQPLYRIKTS